MTVQNIIEKLIDLECKFDQEVAHIEADKLLLEALKILMSEDKYKELEKAYNNIAKWYA